MNHDYNMYGYYGADMTQMVGPGDIQAVGMVQQQEENKSEGILSIQQTVTQIPDNQNNDAS